MEQKGALIATGVILAPHAVMALGGGWKALGLVRKGITIGVIPSFLSPGGGGPRTYPISTNLDSWSDPRYRGYRPSHGY